MKYLIGIDSGGTKSELVAYDLNCKPMYTNIGGYGNPCVDLQSTKTNVNLLIADCIKQLFNDDCIFIGIGMAGVETGNYIDIIQKHIQDKFNIKTIVLNDAEMTCKAYLGSDDGIITIAGTGSSCFVQKDGIGELVGGWGHILGDEGSGYHTVIQEFKHIIYKLDNNIALDRLGDKMLDKIGGKTRSFIMEFIYNNEKNEIASLFPLITKLSKVGDKIAIKLLEDAGKYLAQTTCRAYRKKGFINKIRLNLKGGVFYNSSIVINSYEREIKKGLSNYEIVKKDISATKGVCNIYKLQFSKEL